SQSLTEKFEEIHSSFTLQSKKVKKLQQKANDQHKINKMLEEKIKKCDDNNAKVFKLQEYWNEKNSELKEEFTEEFQAASSFMSHLQTQYESLSHEFKENKAMDMIEVLQFTTDDIIEKILRRQQDMYEKLDHLETEQYHLKKNYADKKKARKNL
ncbi:reticulocyte-binding protein 2 a-like isoform X3, partial [Biomphalaria glabrata]